MNLQAFQDPFLRRTDSIRPRPGCTVFDEIKLQPGPTIPRTFEHVADQKQQQLPKCQDEILTPGAAVGLDEKNVIKHFYKDRNLRFVGFLAGQTELIASVKVRGSILLRLEGVKPEDRGKPVYCSGPNEFSLTPGNGAAEVGVVRYQERDNFAAVSFRRFDDERPLNLKL